VYFLLSGVWLRPLILIVESKKMPICETVSVLASRLEEQLPNITQSQSKMLGVLKDMPRYREKGDLPAWSTDYKACRNKNEKSDPNYTAIELVYEVGRYNVGTEFDEKGTVRIYRVATFYLAKRNISVPRFLDVSQW